MTKTLFLLSLLLLLAMGLYSVNNMNEIAQFQGEHHNSGFGMSMTSLDFNHDGYIDLVVSSPFYGYHVGQTPSRGKIYIYFGGPGFSSNTPASITLEGDYNGTSGRKIESATNIGDINGDGFDDLCVRDYGPGNLPDERLLFFYSGVAILDNPDYIMYFPYHKYIEFVNALGDVNGDGFDDVGLTYFVQGQNLTFSVLMGGGLIENIVMTYPFYDEDGLFVVSSLGDINNDGYADFTVAYTNNDPNTGYHIIRIYYGNASGVYSNPLILIQTQDPITKISKPLGDMNGDGFDDFMGYISNAGTHVWLGATNLNVNTPSFDLTPGWTGGEVSQSMEHGDFNHDGYDDVAGASYDDREFAVYLGRAIVNGTSDLIIHHFDYENFGFGLTTGDYNADGYCDIAVSASHQYVPSGYFPGYVFIYGGNAELADTTVGNEDNVVSDLKNQLHIAISPNPYILSHGKLNINIEGLKGSETGLIEIYNIKGQSVYKTAALHPNGKSIRQAIQISKLASGIYICRAQFGNRIEAKRFSLIQ